MEFCTVLSTTPNIETAKVIARMLVESKLAACVNIIPKVTSIYSWKNEICEYEEILLVIKSRKNLFEKLKDLIIQNHPYEVPEIIMLPVIEGSKDYLEWLKNETMI